MTANGKGPELKIRRAKSADAPRLAELATELGYPSTSAELRQRLRRISPATQNAVFVAEAKDSGVVGWLHVSKQALLESDMRAEVNGLGPILGGSQQPGARAKAAVSLLHDQPVHLRAHVALEERLFAHMQPADNSGVFCFRNEHRILRGGADPPQPLAELGGCRWIAKLGREFCQPRRVRALRAANFQFWAFSIRCHWPAL